MTLQEKVLYHQIHPIKLLTDIGTALIALVLLWLHQLGIALVVMFLPPLVVSWWLIRFANLDRLSRSAFGRYIRMYMTRRMEALRFGGWVLMAAGAWLHTGWLVAVGALMILGGWLRGVILPTS